MFNTAIPSERTSTNENSELKQVGLANGRHL